MRPDPRAGKARSRFSNPTATKNWLGLILSKVAQSRVCQDSAAFRRGAIGSSPRSCPVLPLSPHIAVADMIDPAVHAGTQFGKASSADRASRSAAFQLEKECGYADAMSRLRRPFLTERFFLTFYHCSQCKEQFSAAPRVASVGVTFEQFWSRPMTTASFSEDATGRMTRGLASKEIGRCPIRKAAAFHARQALLRVTELVNLRLTSASRYRYGYYCVGVGRTIRRTTGRFIEKTSIAVLLLGGLSGSVPARAKASKRGMLR